MDKDVFNDFFGSSFAGVDFGKKIERDHPGISINNYSSYIDQYYIKHENEISTAMLSIEKTIMKSENAYWGYMQKIFDNDYSGMNCTGYISIFDCNPRFPETKSFQVFYKRKPKDILGVIYHEITHFCFFEYIKSNLPFEISSLDINDGVLWELSEIFNHIVLNQPELTGTIEQYEKIGYTELQEKTNEINRLWLNKNTLVEFISDSITFLNKTFH